MKRRGFLGFLGGAAVAGPSAAKAAIDERVLSQAGFNTASAGVAPTLPIYAPSGVVGKIVRSIRKTGIPAWKMNELKRRAEHKRANGLDPDIAVLRSVSPGWKAIRQRDRNLQREVEFSLASIAWRGEQMSFTEKLQQKFGYHVDWYD